MDTYQAFRNPGQIMAQASSLEDGQKPLTITGTYHIPRTQPAHFGAPVYAIALGCDLKFAKEKGYTDHMINLKDPSLIPSVLAAKFARARTVSTGELCHGVRN